jgi:hypothetical protein
MSKILTAFVAAILFFCIIAVSTFTKAESSAWVTVNTPGVGTTTLSMKGAFASLNYTDYYSFSAVTNLDTQTVSVLEFTDLLHNSTSGGISRWSLQDINHEVKVLVASFIPGQSLPLGFLFNDKNTLTGAVTTRKWASFKGLEWDFPRGILKGEGFTEITNPVSDKLFFVSGSNPTGVNEQIIGASTVNGKLQVDWTYDSPIPSVDLLVSLHQLFSNSCWLHLR